MLELLSIVAAIAASITGPDPTGHPERWLTDADYPPQSVHEGEQAYPGFMIIVGIDGKPKSCQITSPSAYPHLDSRTCVLMMARSQFKPARDSTGQPIISTYRNYANWKIPGMQPGAHPPFGDLILSVASLPKKLPKRPLVHVYSFVGADGVATGCYVKPDKLVAGLEATACRQVQDGWHFTPLTDDTGRKIPSIQSVIVAFETTPSK
ncbi:energy transducer TonB [Sphingomonas sp. 7/4-4]|uniref:energy transducer TonB n=1 Tax=Sphingomonas sp. 7/4-4 TaxID=3018446 RepID=UPI0022F3BD05|nr:energy transducer TonB [Sphingomonas sp. 7/4-4]WBY09355.1 energy transducer TonB [Sphingomonas sp. 7/4-4]